MELALVTPHQLAVDHKVPVPPGRATVRPANRSSSPSNHPNPDPKPKPKPYPNAYSDPDPDPNLAEPQ